MGKFYSVDFRLCVLKSLDAGLSKMQAHKTYQVSRSTIDDWLALREETGHVHKQPKRVGRKGLYEHEAFEAFIVRHQHSTLEQMHEAWQSEQQQTVSLMCLSRALRSAGYTRKKRATSTAKDEKKNANASPHR